MVASESQELLTIADKIVTPLVDSLHYIGLGVTKPFMDGHMPERYYANLIGIGVWGVAIYNVRTIVWLANYRGILNFVNQATRKAQELKGWSPRQAWFRIRLFLVFFMIPICAYSLASFMNSIHGWFVFHVKDLLTPLLLIATFQVPGMFISGLLAPLAIYLIHDLKHALTR
ncbi:MAG: hypothetical protein AB1720_11360 [Pseudomonadota bacterium]